MRKKTPYSVASDLHFAFVSEIESFARLPDGSILLNFTPGKNWHCPDITAGSLQVNSSEERTFGGIHYKTKVSFRISFNEINNLKEATNIQSEDVIIYYVSAGGQKIVIGDILYPLCFTISLPSDWDGYEITGECIGLYGFGFLLEK